MGINYLKSLLLTLLYGLGITHLFGQYQMEKLDRGLVSVRSGNNNFVSWRWLGNEDDISFNLYRNGTKVNANPLTVSNYQDNGAAANASYTVRAVVSGVEQQASTASTPWANLYMRLPLQIPAGGTTPSGEAYTYTANDCSVGDVDGDGKYEVFLKWDPSNAKDNSQSGYTGNVYIDCYTLTGTLLWRVDLGRNIRAGAHYTQFLVYDFDGDGLAEFACKTADGTKDGKGVVIGNASADYRNSTGYILTGPEYLTVFNGKTGAAMATANYTPGRGTVSSWGDGYGNRVDRFIAAVAYLDGQRPSMVFGRGYYTRLVRSAWDWRDGKLTQRWIFDSNTSGNSSYAGQGNHQLSVGDFDGDGKQEVCNGSSAINDDGKGLYANGTGHGDALHVSDLDPDRPGLEVWQCHEDEGSYGNYGLEFRDAKTGIPIWGLGGGKHGDLGRCMAADIDPRHKGYEVWGSAGAVYNCKGTVISTTMPSMNFGVYWDGDLQRELLDGNKLDKWNYANSTSSRLATLYNENYGGGTPCNGSKNTPNLSADLFGDWREEIILHAPDNTALLIYTTVITSAHKFRTLMHDPQYRMAIAWQNGAYNQPPHLGYYLGSDMATPTKPNIVIVGGPDANVAPTVQLTAPANNASFTAPATISITANAADSDGNIAKVEFYNGANKLGEDATAPYAYSWAGVTAGTYTLTAKATDNDGAVTTSTSVTITVTSTNSAPAISITSPSTNTVINGAPATVTINVNANDTDGNIAKVEFYNGTTKLGEDASSPYSYVWTGVVAGTYSITAIATDNLGATTTSSAVVISVVEIPADCNGVVGGTASPDACGRCVGGNTGKVACSSFVEAEDDTCAIVGIIENTNEGFGGTGYVNVNNSITSYVEFAVYAQFAGTATLSFRYANGTTADRPAQILVNGTALANNVSFPSSSAWNDWDVVEVQIPFVAGNNKLRLVSTTANGLANIDQIGFVSNTVGKGVCGVVTLTNDELHKFGMSLYPNPSSDNFDLQLAQTADVKVFSTLGALVQTFSNRDHIKFGDQYQAGVYSVQVSTLDQTYVFRIIKK